MEPVVPSGEITPLIEDTAVLTVEDDFESIYDVPFVTVNRVGGEIEAEVQLCGVRHIDDDRLSTAHSVAGELGYRAYARVFGLSGQVLLYFSSDPSSGTIWALENELDNAWLQ